MVLDPLSWPCGVNRPLSLRCGGNNNDGRIPLMQISYKRRTHAFISPLLMNIQAYGNLLTKNLIKIQVFQNMFSSMKKRWFLELDGSTQEEFVSDEEHAGHVKDHNMKSTLQSMKWMLQNFESALSMLGSFSLGNGEEDAIESSTIWHIENDIGDQVKLLISSWAQMLTKSL